VELRGLEPLTPTLQAGQRMFVGIRRRRIPLFSRGIRQRRTSSNNRERGPTATTIAHSSLDIERDFWMERCKSMRSHPRSIWEVVDE
jgi:hypothetical protein